MGWVKLDDGFFRHPKVVGVSRDARFLYLAGLCYCGANLTDGLIPDGALRLLAADIEIKNPRAAADDLMAAGLWRASDGGFLIHNYLEYNRSSESVQGEREASAKRMQHKRSENVRPNIDRSSENVRPKFGRCSENVQQQDKDRDTEKNGVPSEHVANDDPPEPTGTPEEPMPDGEVYRLVDAWAVATGWEKPKFAGQLRKEAFNALKPVVGLATADDVARCVAVFLASPWWAEPGRLTVKKLAESLPLWISRGRPEAAIDAPRPNSPTRGMSRSGRDIGFSNEELDRRISAGDI